MGITHHSNYIRFMEEARVDFLEKIGFGYAKMEEDGYSSPVLSIECNYRHSTTFSDEISVGVKAVRCAGVRLVIGYTMTCRGTVVFEGSSTHCFFNRDGRPLMIQKQMPEFYAALGIEEE